MKISVVIPVYNRPDELTVAIKSVLEQTLKAHEIIVVDDCSPIDLEKALPERLLSKVTFIRLSKNSGAAEARNVGVAASRGEFIAFLDSDDTWLPQKLEKQVKLFQQTDGQLATVYCGVRGLFSDHDEVILPSHWGAGVGVEQLIRKGNVVIGGFSSVVMRREWFDRVGGIDSILRSRQDYDLHLRVAEAGGRFEYVDEALVEFKLSGADRISTNHRGRVMGVLAVHRKHRRLFEQYVGRAFSDLVEASRRLSLLGKPRFARRVFLFALKQYGVPSCYGREFWSQFTKGVLCGVLGLRIWRER